MTDFSVIKIDTEFKASASQKNLFFFPREFSILNELEILPPSKEVTGKYLTNIGMFSAGANQPSQIEMWGIPIKDTITVNSGKTFVFERDAVIDQLGKSYFLPLAFIRDCVFVPGGGLVSNWAKRNGLDVSHAGNKPYVIREQAKRLVLAAKRDDSKIITPPLFAPDSQSPSPTVSDGDLLNHSQELIDKKDNHVPPQLPVIDLTPTSAPLVTTLDEVNLNLLRQAWDMLEESKLLFKDANEFFSVLVNQNRHIFKSIKSIDVAIKAMLQSFDIDPPAQ